jgi:hypothetical protein
VGACRRIAAFVKSATAPSISRGRGAQWRLGSMVMCEPVYRGSGTMTVRGWFAGYRIDDRYTREDGCAMSKYDTMARILGVPASASGDESASL